jgi:hypothetical protein
MDAEQPDQPAKPRKRGTGKRFTPGNKASRGRRKLDPAEKLALKAGRERFVELAPEAFRALEEILQDRSPRRAHIREKAAEYVIDQALGRARQSVAVTGPNGEPLNPVGPVQISVSFCSTLTSAAAGEAEYIDAAGNITPDPPRIAPANPPEQTPDDPAGSDA